MNKLFLSVALLVVAPAFVFADESAKPASTETAKPASAEQAKVDEAAVKAAAIKVAEEAVKTAQTSFDEATKALKENKDAAQAEALKKNVDAAAATLKSNKLALSDLNPSYAARALKFANGQVASVSGLIARNPLMAVATVVALTVAAVEAVHYFAASEDEEAQF